MEELENLRLEGDPPPHPPFRSPLLPSPGGFQPISPNDALAARSQWKEGGDVIMGTPHYPPDPPVEILTKQNLEEWNGGMIDPYHSSLEVYEGEDPVDRTFYKSFKYRPFHLPRPVLKLQKLKNLKLALKSKLKLKLKSKPLLKFPKLKKLKFKGLHKPKRKPSYKPHSTGRPSYKTVTPEEPSYETTNKPTTTTSHPTYTVSYSPVFEEPTSYKPAAKLPPSTSLAPAYSPPYRPPPVLEAYSRPTYEAAKKFPEGFVEVASRVPEQPLPAAWEEDFGPRLEELLDLEARVNNANFPSVNSFTDNFSTTFVWDPPHMSY